MKRNPTKNLCYRQEIGYLKKRNTFCIISVYYVGGFLYGRKKQ